MPHEVFEHTADLGIRVTADTLEELFAEAAAGLLEVLTEDPTAVAAGETRELSVAGEDRAALLADWLSELLFAFETQKMLFCEFDVRIGPGGLAATVRGEPYDPARHSLAHEIKAVTHHLLEVGHGTNGWHATFVVDI